MKSEQTILIRALSQALGLEYQFVEHAMLQMIRESAADVISNDDIVLSIDHRLNVAELAIEDLEIAVDHSAHQ